MQKSFDSKYAMLFFPANDTKYLTMEYAEDTENYKVFIIHNICVRSVICGLYKQEASKKG